MGTFSVFISGGLEEVREVRDRVSEVGVALGYGARRGDNAGRGAPGLMLRDLAEGKAAFLPAGARDDWEWLGGELSKLLEAHPERRELLVSGIEACKAAAEQRKRGLVGGVDRGGRFELTEG